MSSGRLLNDLKLRAHFSNGYLIHIKGSQSRFSYSLGPEQKKLTLVSKTVLTSEDLALLIKFPLNHIPDQRIFLPLMIFLLEKSTTKQKQRFNFHFEISLKIQPKIQPNNASEKTAPTSEPRHFIGKF